MSIPYSTQLPEAERVFREVTALAARPKAKGRKQARTVLRGAQHGLDLQPYVIRDGMLLGWQGSLGAYRVGPLRRVEPFPRIAHGGYTIEIGMRNSGQRGDESLARALVDAVIPGDRYGHGPIIDVDRAAAVTTQADPTYTAAYLRAEASQLAAALCHVGAYLIDSDMLEAERLALDPRAAEIVVAVQWPSDARETCSLSMAMYRHARHRNSMRRDSGLRFVRPVYKTHDDPGFSTFGQRYIACWEVDRRPIITVAREILASDE